nr:DUF488 family protein [Actinomadura macra]
MYEPATVQDGTRVLVDRVWPRGLTKDAARLSHWEKDVAPSTELRKWYGHESDKFPEFKRRYETELQEPTRAAALERLRALAAKGPLTLLTATKDLPHSQAAILVDHVST